MQFFYTQWLQSINFEHENVSYSTSYRVSDANPCLTLSHVLMPCNINGRMYVNMSYIYKSSPIGIGSHNDIISCFWQYPDGDYYLPVNMKLQLSVVDENTPEVGGLLGAESLQFFQGFLCESATMGQ